MKVAGNGQVLKQLPPSQSFQVSASGSTILFQDWEILSVLWTYPTNKILLIQMWIVARETKALKQADELILQILPVPNDYLELSRIMPITTNPAPIA